MSPSRKTYDDDFKLAAVRLSDDIGVKPAAKKLKISLSTLKNWRGARKKERTERVKAPKVPRKKKDRNKEPEDQDFSWVLEDSELRPVFEGLTLKQRKFVGHYCEVDNGTLAAELAGYGEDPASLASMASQNLRKLKVKTAIDALLKRSGRSEDMIIARLRRQADVNLGDFVTIHDDGSWDWDLAKAKRLGVLQHIRELRTEETFDKKGNRKRKISLKLIDPQAAAMNHARVRKLVTEKHEHSHSMALDADTLQALDREAEDLAEKELREGGFDA